MKTFVMTALLFFNSTSFAAQGMKAPQSITCSLSSSLGHQVVLIERIADSTLSNSVYTMTTPREWLAEDGSCTGYTSCSAKNEMGLIKVDIFSADGILNVGKLTLNGVQYRLSCRPSFK